MTRSVSSESFPKSARLLRRPEFLRVQRRGKRVVLQDVIVAFRRSPTIASRTRVGFTVSKKVGNAVVRNRVRRRLRDVVRKHLSLHRNAACRDIVFIARASASTAPYSRLADQVVHGLEVAHGLTKRPLATKSGSVGN